jgi:hypothetical protein
MTYLGRGCVSGILLTMLLWACAASAASGAPSVAILSEDQIRQALIQESIRNYPGPCPCPYNVARNGSRCGSRSAYTKPGGYSPICYPPDVSPEMIQKFRNSPAR